MQKTGQIIPKTESHPSDRINKPIFVSTFEFKGC